MTDETVENTPEAREKAVKAWQASATSGDIDNLVACTKQIVGMVSHNETRVDGLFAISIYLGHDGKVKEGTSPSVGQCVSDIVNAALDAGKKRSSMSGYYETSWGKRFSISLSRQPDKNVDAESIDPHNSERQITE